MIIAICGIDGSGKTTQIKRIKEKLEAKQKKVYCTKQPTDWYRSDARLQGYLTGKIKEEPLLLKELALFSAADRLRHYQLEILPKEKEGYIIICDRYVFTTYAYFMARGIKDYNWLKEINKFIVMPDLIIYIDVPAEIALKRIVERDGISSKKEEKDFNRLNDICNLFRNQPWGKNNNYYSVDGTKDINDLANEISQIVDKYI